MPARGFVFWALFPSFLIFALALPLLAGLKTVTAVVVLAATEVLSVFVLLGLWNGERFGWAWRGVAWIVFAGCAAYLVHGVVGGLPLIDRRSQPSLLNAILAFIAFGMPALRFALFGDLAPGGNDPEDSGEEFGSEEEDDDEE